MDVKCSKYGILKDINLFYLQKYNSNGHSKKCKECIKEEKNNLLDVTKIILFSAKNRARKKKIEYNLSIDDIEEIYIKQDGMCALSNTLMNFKVGKDKYNVNPHKISIDRIDSKKGYTKNNIQLV